MIELEKGDTMDDLKKKFGLKGNISNSEAIAFGGKGYYHIAFYKGCSPGVIGHECLHVINYLFISCGIQYDLHNDEPACYLLTWFVDQCANFKAKK